MLLFGYHKEFIFKEKGFFKISQNKNSSKITHHTVYTKGASLLATRYTHTHIYIVFKTKILILKRE